MFVRKGFVNKNQECSDHYWVTFWNFPSFFHQNIWLNFNITHRFIRVKSSFKPSNIHSESIFKVNSGQVQAHFRPISGSFQNILNIFRSIWGPNVCPFEVSNFCPPFEHLQKQFSLNFKALKKHHKCIIGPFSQINSVLVRFRGVLVFVGKLCKHVKTGHVQTMRIRQFVWWRRRGLCTRPNG